MQLPKGLTVLFYAMESCTVCVITLFTSKTNNLRLNNFKRDISMEKMAFDMILFFMQLEVGDLSDLNTKGILHGLSVALLQTVSASELKQNIGELKFDRMSREQHCALVDEVCGVIKDFSIYNFLLNY